MPLYYFHVRCADEVDEDDEGLVFQNDAAAIADARLALIEMAHEAARLNISLDVKGMIIAKWDDQVVATISIEDAMNGNVTKH